LKEIIQTLCSLGGTCRFYKWHAINHKFRLDHRVQNSWRAKAQQHLLAPLLQHTHVAFTSYYKPPWSGVLMQYQKNSKVGEQ